ncbi:hypothetical protein Q6A86_02735 [Aliarcobacter skirrowii]|uniref:hypothetical protein n=1 Tax=Aliarcobacter skirrowii TaxID=28200 RepID=UPI0029BBEB4B|nr:hypothetical protein [Aliarcobacter skirrowii]MDX4011897.1 hypothetical protein [Aliarcobacter skirrowii]MDX4066108.1 hypothetical protein [Aliarcobacter skirrowii]
MQTDVYEKIMDLIVTLENEKSRYKNNFEDISTKIMLKNILDKLHEIIRLSNQYRDKQC